MDKGKTYSEIYNTSSDTNDVLHVVIERLKSLNSLDVQEIGYGQGLEDRSFKNLTGDYIRTEDIKKIIKELTNAL